MNFATSDFTNKLIYTILQTSFCNIFFVLVAFIICIFVAENIKYFIVMKQLIFLLMICTWVIPTFSQMHFATKSFSVFGTAEVNDSIYLETNSTPSNKKLIIKNKIRSAVYNNEIQMLPEILDSVDWIAEKVIDIFTSDLPYIDATAPKIKMDLDVSDDFVFADELCRVSVNYVVGEDLNNQHINLGSGSVSHYAKPSALAKYYSLEDVLSESDVKFDVKVVLNEKFLTKTDFSEDFSFNLDISRHARENEYDLATLLLRALIAGCGFHSELSKQVPYGLLSVFVNIDNNSYLTLFDSKITNDDNQRFPNPNEVANLSNTAIHNLIGAMLDNSSISFYSYELFNDYDFSHNFLCGEVANYLAFDEENDNEIMQTFLFPGVTIRKITPKTANILYYLGWRYDLAVGPTFPTKSITIADTLYSQTPYDIQLQNCDAGVLTIKMLADNNDFILYRQNVINGYFPLTFTYDVDTIPNRYWIRDISNGHVKTIVAYEDSHGSLEKTVYIPLKPSEPIIYVDTISTGTYFSANVHFSAAGAQKYVVACHDLNSNVAEYDTINIGNVCTFTNLTSSHNYEFYVKAINNAGDATNLYFLFCNYAPEYWSLTVGQTGQTIRYTVAYGVMQIEYPVVLSEIYTTSGTCLLSQHSPEKTIDVSGIARGIYILKVTLDNGVVVSKRFAKR